MFAITLTISSSGDTRSLGRFDDEQWSAWKCTFHVMASLAEMEKKLKIEHTRASLDVGGDSAGWVCEKPAAVRKAVDARCTISS